MKRNRTLPLALVTFAALTFASNAAPGQPPLGQQ